MHLCVGWMWYGVAAEVHIGTENMRSDRMHEYIGCCCHCSVVGSACDARNVHLILTIGI